MHRSASCLAVLTLSIPALAGEMNPRRIAADATWMLHVDVEALSTSAIGKYIIEHGDQLDLDQFEEETGLDPFKDIYGVTLYGEGDPDDDGVAVLMTSAKVDELVEHAAGEPDYRRIEVDGRTLHRWDDDDETLYAHVTRTGPGRRMVILSDRRMKVIDAAAVTEGKLKSLADRLDADPADDADSLPHGGSLVFAMARGMPWLDADDDDPAAAIARRSDRIMFELRQPNSTTTADLVISARSGNDAANISDVLRGLLALGKLIASQDPAFDDAESFLRAIRIDAEHNDIKVHVEADSDHILEHLDVIMEHVGPIE